MFWVVSVYSVYQMGLPNTPFWFGVLFSAGWSTIVLASLAVPFLIRRSARSTFLLSEAIEILLTLVYFLAITERQVTLFVALVVVAGTFDEIAKAVLPSILKSMVPEGVEKAVSGVRTWQSIARLAGTLIGGASFALVGNASYFILAGLLVVAVAAAVSFPSAIMVYEGATLIQSLRGLLGSFTKSIELKFTTMLSYASLLAGFAGVFITQLLVTHLQASSAEYGTYNAVTYLASAIGAYAAGKVKWSTKYVIGAWFALQGVATFFMGLVPNLLVVLTSGALLFVASGLATTQVFQKIYHDYPKETVALVAQLVYFLMSVALMIGSIGGGSVGLVVNPALGLIWLSPLYLLVGFVWFVVARKY